MAAFNYEMRFKAIETMVIADPGRAIDRLSKCDYPANDKELAYARFLLERMSRLSNRWMRAEWRTEGFKAIGHDG